MFAKLIYLALFLLPWQSRYIFGQKTISGEPFEYGVLSIYAVEVIIVVAFFLGQRLRILREHQTAARSIGIVLVAAALSIPFSEDPDLSLVAWSHLVFAAMLFVILLDRRVDRERALLAFTLGLIAPAVLGLMQVFSGTSPASTLLGLASHGAGELGAAVVESGPERFLRAYGSFGHPNIFGGYLAIAIVGCLASAFRVRISNYHFPLSNFLIPIFSFSLILTFSRSAWLALVAAILVSGTILIWKHRRHHHCTSPGDVQVRFGVLAVSTLIAVVIFFNLIVPRADLSAPLEARSIGERIEQMQTFPTIWGQGMILGVGLGAYTLALAEVEPGIPAWAYQPIHNAVLLALAEVGLVGLIALIFWAGTVDRLNYAAIGRGSVGAVFGIGLGTVLLVIAMLDHYLWSQWSGLSLMALAMALTLRLSEKD